MKDMDVLKLRGLPWSASTSDIVEWLGDDIRVSGGSKGVHISLNRDGRPSGEAYVEIEEEEDLELGLKKDNEHMGRRYIEVFRVDRGEMKDAERREDQRGGDNDSGGPSECFVKMRGLPYETSNEEIAQFFSGYSIQPGGVHICEDYSGRPSGNAFVEFRDVKTADKALSKHKEHIGKRYVEIFRATPTELRNMERESRGRGSYNDRRSGPYDRYGGRDDRFGGRSSYRDDGPGPMRGRYSNPYSNSGRPSILMRGLPFSCTERDVDEFFHPIDVRDINIIYERNGRASGEANVSFHNADDADRAMKKDKANMMHRYIELFLEGSGGRRGGGRDRD